MLSLKAAVDGENRRRAYPIAEAREGFGQVMPPTHRASPYVAHRCRSHRCPSIRISARSVHPAGATGMVSRTPAAVVSSPIRLPCST